MVSLNLDLRDCISQLMPVINDLQKVEELMQGFGVPMPKAKNDDGLKARLLCPKWWRRVLDRLKQRVIEKGQIDRGVVRKGKQVYVSDNSHKKKVRAAVQSANYMSQMSMVSNTGEVVDMDTIIAASLANPTNRRAELMIRMAGFEIYSAGLGWVGEFYTFTCPSKFHRFSGSVSNEAYDVGLSPRDAQKYLTGQWSKIRAKLARQGIKPFGFRVAEPHHDGCPHWHMLLFVEPSQRERMRSIMRHYALEMDGNEPGADVHRFKAVEIDSSVGTATGYIAKYISKNLGFDIGDTEHDQTDDSRNYGQRVKAWASTWGVRQFQQIGGCPVTVWRQLRKLPEGSCTGVLEEARKAADESRWADYLVIMTRGEPDTKRADMAVHLLKSQEVSPSTGELHANAYGEILEIIYGVCALSQFAITKTKYWSMQASKSALQALAAEGPVGPQALTPWSPVNNCTAIAA